MMKKSEDEEDVMTVSTTHTKVIYQGDGTTRQWAYTFPIMREDHISIFVTTKDGQTERVQANYQVKPLQKQVIYPVTGKALETGCKIALLRKTPLTQELDLVNNGGFFPENIEQTFDRSVLVEQELLEQLDRSVKMPETSSENRDFAYEIIEARNRAETAAQKSEIAQQNAESESNKAEEQAVKANQEANRAKIEADRARQAADEAVVGGIRSVNGKQGNDIVLTPEDIGASPEEHSHKLLDQVPKIEARNAGKSLVIHPDGTKAEWQMLSGIPVGTIIAWGGLTPPAGYLECAGQSLNRAIYKGLFSAIGTTWGSDSLPTFKLPDFKSAARFLRSRGDGVEVGQVQGDAIRNIVGAFDMTGSGLGIHPPHISAAINQQGVFSSNQFGNISNGAGAGGAIGKNGISFDISRVVPTSNENRPKSAVIMYCIKVTDEYVNPEQVNMANVVREIEERVRREEVQKITGTRLWISGEYQPISNTATIVEHGLEFDPLKCTFEVILKNNDSDSDYNVGDIIHGSGILTSPGTGIEYPLNISLNKDSIQVTTRPDGLYSSLKKSGGNFKLNLAKWRYVFRIWY